MTRDQREIHRKKRVLEYAERIGNINKACRYFGVARSSFYEWRDRYRELDDDLNRLLGLDGVHAAAIHLTMLGPGD